MAPQKVGFHEPDQARILSDLILCKSYASSNSHCECVRTTALSCPENTVLLCTSTPSGSSTLSALSSMVIPGPFEGGNVI